MRKRKNPGLNDSTTMMKEGTLGATQISEVKFGVVKNKKPTARDGHSASIDKQGRLFVFGGDRHHMPFNDLYMIKLN